MIYDNGSNKFRCPIKNVDMALVVGDLYYEFDKERKEYRLFPYRGIFDNIDSVPNEECIFELRGEQSNQYFLKRIDESKFINLQKEEKKRNNIKLVRTNLFDLKIDSKDNELMIIVKKLLNGTSIDALRVKFDTIGDFNNFKTTITNSHNLSFQRFKDLLHRLGITKYEILVHVDDDTIVTNNI